MTAAVNLSPLEHIPAKKAGQAIAKLNKLPPVAALPHPPKAKPSPAGWEGQGDLVSRLITSITHMVTLIIPFINLLTKSPWPPKQSS